MQTCVRIGAMQLSILSVSVCLRIQNRVLTFTVKRHAMIHDRRLQGRNNNTNCQTQARICYSLALNNSNSSFTLAQYRLRPSL